jgi:DNA polymerase III subunit chi
VTEVAFYQLRRTPLAQALPEILEKVLARGWRAVVRASSPERVEALNGQLWTYGRASFLPHGSRADGHADRQPVWLTDAEENPNRADVLVLVDGAEAGSLAGFQRVVDMFDGNDAAATEAARRRWQSAKAAGHAVAFWQQGERGWEKKAD